MTSFNQDDHIMLADIALEPHERINMCKAMKWIYQNQMVNGQNNLKPKEASYTYNISTIIWHDKYSIR